MKSIFIAGCLVALVAGAAQGNIIAYDGIDYPLGMLNGRGPDTGITGPWSADLGVNVSGAGLSNTLALTPKGKNVSGFFDFIATLTNTIAPGPGKEFWASYLLYHSGPNDQAFMGLGPAGAVLGSLPSAAFGVRLGQYGIFEGGSFTPAPIPFTANGSTDFLVVHFKSGVGVWNVDLFVNQGTFTAPVLSTTVAAVTYGTVINHNQAQFESDEYRIGETSADVAASPTPVLPATWGRLKSLYH